MYGMFEGCSKLTSLDVSNFNTTNVTDMYGMFEGCSNLESLDVSKFNTANVTNMSSMFYGCSTLKTLYCNDSWSCDNSQGMFTACTSLVGAISYDEAKTDVTFANPTTGYFTAVAKGDANGDGEISDEDVKTAEGHIMGNKPTKYVFVGADSNGDGKINVADIVDIVNKKK
jgi:surface protein